MMKRIDVVLSELFGRRTVDALTVKAIVSRKKSVDKLKAEIADMKAKAAGSDAAVAAVWLGMVKVREQRLERLVAELAALERVQAEARGPELPLAGRPPGKR